MQCSRHRELIAKGHLAITDYHWEVLLVSALNRTASITRNYLAQNVDSVEVGKPYCRLDFSIRNFIHSVATEAFGYINDKCVSCSLFQRTTYILTGKVGCPSTKSVISQTFLNAIFSPSEIYIVMPTKSQLQVHKTGRKGCFSFEFQYFKYLNKHNS